MGGHKIEFIVTETGPLYYPTGVTHGATCSCGWVAKMGIRTNEGESTPIDLVRQVATHFAVTTMALGPEAEILLEHERKELAREAALKTLKSIKPFNSGVPIILPSYSNHASGLAVDLNAREPEYDEIRVLNERNPIRYIPR